ncbi:hypothetical protein [Limnohabitans sp. 15K]|uniref:hypothetical protein n=1 Tax=Limnohabitans sp. 15K TaxID=1100706 RepID=UPI000C1E6F5B|nr:hypothetical protein [Limnohabitans sp. 15K]PIT82944.1 hypothetical protein B9Z40_04405 [Limnohabitans sp. 15K]
MNTSTTANADVVTPAKKAAPRKAAPKAVKKAVKKAVTKVATKAVPNKPVRKVAQKAASPASTSAKTTATAPAPVQVKTAVQKPAASPERSLKDKKVKVVRDSFTIPKSELLQIGESKKRALALGVEIKKSELIRAGLQALTSMNDAAFKKALANVPTIKTGRPAKS